MFCIILVGENETAFGIQKDFLIAKSAHFRKYFAEKKEEQVEDVVRFPNTDPVVFGLAQLFMFSGTINTAPKMPNYDMLIAVWKLGNELGIDGLCEEALQGMSEYRAATNSIPATGLLVKAWEETPEGSPIRTLFLSWTAEYIRSSESRAEFTKSLPQEVLSELVVAMSHLNSTPAIQVKPPISPSTQQKNVHYLEHEGGERDRKTIKHRHPDATVNRAKKATPKPSLPVAPKPPKTKRASINVNEDNLFSPDHKLNFCADLLNRMLSGPGKYLHLRFNNIILPSYLLCLYTLLYHCCPSSLVCLSSTTIHYNAMVQCLPLPFSRRITDTDAWQPRTGARCPQEWSGS